MNDACSNAIYRLAGYLKIEPFRDMHYGILVFQLDDKYYIQDSTDDKTVSEFEEISVRTDQICNIDDVRSFHDANARKRLSVGDELLHVYIHKEDVVVVGRLDHVSEYVERARLEHRRDAITISPQLGGSRQEDGYSNPAAAFDNILSTHYPLRIFDQELIKCIT